MTTSLLNKELLGCNKAPQKDRRSRIVICRTLQRFKTIAAACAALSIAAAPVSAQDAPSLSNDVTSELSSQLSAEDSYKIFKNVSDADRNSTPNNFLHTFSDGIVFWKVDLLSGTIQAASISDGRTPCWSETGVVYRSASSFAPSASPCFEVVKESIISGRVYLTVLERDLQPIDDRTIDAPPKYSWRILAFAPSAQGRLAWSFVPEQFIHKLNEKREGEERLDSRFLSIERPLAPEPNSDSLVVVVRDSQKNLLIECKLDAASGTILSFTLSR